MNKLLCRLSARFFQQHPGQLVALLLTITLGVAGSLSIWLLNHRALQSFADNGRQLQAGQTHRLTAIDRALTMADFVWLKREQKIARAAPVIAQSVELQTKLGANRSKQVQLLALDWVAERNLGRGLIAERMSERSERASPVHAADRRADEQIAPVWVSADLQALDIVSVLAKGKPTLVRVIGVLPEGSSVANTIIADLPTWQRINGRAEIDRIDLQLDNEQIAPLLADLPSTLSLIAIDSRKAMLSELTQALRTNLLALGGMSVLVAIFLIALSLRYAYLLRAADFYRMRALGVERWHLRGYLIAESGILGALGGLIGARIASVLATRLALGFSQTVNALYHANVWLDQRTPLALYMVATLLGAGSALLGCLWPMLQMERISIGQSLHRRSQEQLPTLNLALVVVLLLALAAFGLFAQRGLLAGFLGLGLVALAIAAAVPMLLRALLWSLRKALGQVEHFTWQFSVALAASARSRLAPALSALALALALPVGMDLMVGSFRGALLQWLEQSVVGELFIARNDGLRIEDLRTLQALSAQPVIQVRTRQITILGKPAEIFACDVDHPERFSLLSGAWDQPRFANGTGVLISETLANKMQLGVGQTLQLQANGPRKTVLAVYRDYRSEHGIVAMAIDAYQREFQDPYFSTLGMLEGASIYHDVESLRSKLASDQRPQAAQSAIGPNMSLRVFSKADIRRESLAIFDRTFQLTDKLKYVAAALAAIGLFAALLALDLEQSSDYQRMRKLGFSTLEIRAHRWRAGLLLSLLAGVLAMPIGILLAWLLTRQINQRAFGWTFDLLVAPAATYKAPSLAIAAGIVALVLASAFAPKQAAARLEIRE